MHTIDLGNLLEFSLRAFVALLLGALMGFERQRRHGLAGGRTNALVACGAAQFVMLSSLIGSGDPTRIAAQIVSGIGFLGAGVILRDGFQNVRGLNTAATLWAASAVGALAGAGYLAHASVGALLVVLANSILRQFDKPRGAKEAEAPKED